MNCALCSGYLAWKHGILRARGKIYHCTRCRPRNKHCAFVKKQCQDYLKLLKGEVEFCSECASFPCEALMRLDERYRCRHGMRTIENLLEIREEGMAVFLRDQYARYRCPAVGASARSTVESASSTTPSPAGGNEQAVSFGMAIRGEWRFSGADLRSDLSSRRLSGYARKTTEFVRIVNDLLLHARTPVLDIAANLRWLPLS